MGIATIFFLAQKDTSKRLILGNTAKTTSGSPQKGSSPHSQGGHTRKRSSSAPKPKEFPNSNSNENKGNSNFSALNLDSFGGASLLGIFGIRILEF